MTKNIFTVGTLALALASAPPAFAHGGRGGGGCFHGGGRILHSLDLSADQQQRVRDIMAAHKTTMRPLIAHEKAAEEALRDKLFGSTVAQQDLDPLIEQEAQARTAVTRERLTTALEVRQVLTPAQREKAAKIRAGMKDLHAQMRELVGAQDAD